MLNLVVIGNNYIDTMLNKEQFRLKLIEKASKSEMLLISALAKDADLSGTYEFQKIFNPYIVDFYFKHLNLAVEVDGSSHNYSSRYDQMRSIYLKSKYNLNIIRVSNYEVYKGVHFVLAKIKLYKHSPFKKQKTLYPKYKDKNKFGIGGWYKIY